MELTTDQTKFIESKVKAPGSMKAVKKFYDKDCPVDKYANKIANKIFNTKSNRR